MTCALMNIKQGDAGEWIWRVKGYFELADSQGPFKESHISPVTQEMRRTDVLKYYR